MTEPLAPGDKVECINGTFNCDPSWLRQTINKPISGRVYTVRALEPSRYVGDPDAILLSEVINPPGHFCDGFLEPAFNVARFRPIRRRETSITIFQELVREVKQGAPREIVDA